MAVTYKRPTRAEYNTDEDYEEALRLYEWAIFEAEEKAEERYHEKYHNN